MSDIRKVWCTQCWWSFTLDVAALERQRVPAIECPDCAATGQLTGHIVRGMIFCNDCHDFGCDASVCRCTCHKEKIDG